jgi:hypothetical protein
VIQVYRPAREIEEILGGSPVTGVQLVDGKVQTYIEYSGQPSMFTEDPEQVFGAIRVTGATLTGAELRDGSVYYTLAKVEHAYVPANFLARDWMSRDGRLRTLTGVHLAGDGVDYQVVDGGRPDVIHESEQLVLRTIRISGVRLTGAELRNGSVYYTLA